MLVATLHRCHVLDLMFVNNKHRCFANRLQLQPVNTLFDNIFLLIYSYVFVYVSFLGIFILKWTKRFLSFPLGDWLFFNLAFFQLLYNTFFINTFFITSFALTVSDFNTFLKKSFHAFKHSSHSFRIWSLTSFIYKFYLFSCKLHCNW